LHDRDVERAELTWAITHVGEGDTVIDAGANVGLYSIVLARAVGPTGRVVAFEPVPETVERLRASVQVNGLANVQIEAAAVGDTDARVQFNLAHDSAYSGLAEDPRSPTVSRHVVSMVTIDSVWSSIGEPHVTFVKLDVEGAETKALVGATMLIERCRPLIMAEAAAEDRLEELCGWLSQRGYEQRTPPGFRPYNHLFGPVSSAHEQSSQPVTS
jgi:FkbM family methyltransferase